jgi:integrase
MKLTQGAVTALVSTKPDQVFWDDAMPGFGARVRNGRKTWLVQYRTPAGVQRREALGDVRKVPLDAARAIARKRFAQIELGADPGADRLAAKAAAMATELTLGLVVDRYLEARRPSIRGTVAKEMERYFTRHWAPLRNLPLAKVTRAQVAARLQVIIKDQGPIAGARARAYLSAAYAWAMGEGLADANVVVGTNNPDTRQSRDRVLTDAELRAIWNATGRDNDFDQIVRLLILLGCRRQEIGSLRWSELDLDAGVMTISGERTKSGNALELTLPETALNILRARSSEGRTSTGFVFGAGATGFASWSPAVADLNARIGAQIGERWTLHDIRRTVRSGMARLGIRPDIAERCVGHAVGGSIAKIYDRYSYAAEMRNALLTWAAHIAGLVEGRGAKIISMR